MAKRRKQGRAGEPVELPEPTERERVQWLLQLLERDVTSLRPGEWLDLLVDAQRYLWPQMDYADPGFEAAIKDWHPEVRRGLEALAQDHQWTFREPLTQQLTHLRARIGDGSVRPVFARHDLRSGLMSATVDIVVRWFPELRRCRHCGAWFLPRHGRQQYHTPTCSTRARWKRFAPKRERDHHAEYAQRLKKAAPGARPQRRPRGK